MSFKGEHSVHRLQQWMQAARASTQRQCAPQGFLPPRGISVHQMTADKYSNGSVPAQRRTSCQGTPCTMPMLLTTQAGTTKKQLHDAPHECHPIGLLGVAFRQLPDLPRAGKQCGHTHATTTTEQMNTSGKRVTVRTLPSWLLSTSHAFICAMVMLLGSTPSPASTAIGSDLGAASGSGLRAGDCNAA